MRPVMREPPLCTLHELKTVYSINELADFHEAMDEESYYQQQVEKLNKRK
jgi:hypothetical protein